MEDGKDTHGMIRASVKPHVLFPKFGFYRPEPPRRNKGNQFFTSRESFPWDTFHSFLPYFVLRSLCCQLSVSCSMQGINLQHVLTHPTQLSQHRCTLLKYQEDRILVISAAGVEWRWDITACKILCRTFEFFLASAWGGGRG